MTASAVWVETARRYLERYMDETGAATFTSPRVRRWAEAQGLRHPPHLRAWGAVFRSASEDGAIEAAGFEVCPDEDMHCQSVRTWKRADSVSVVSA